MLSGAGERGRAAPQALARPEYLPRPPSKLDNSESSMTHIKQQIHLVSLKTSHRNFSQEEEQERVKQLIL